MVEVKIYVNEKVIRRGDVESDYHFHHSEKFSSAKAAQKFVKSKMNDAKYRGKKTSVFMGKKKDEISRLTVFTGERWINENSGEECLGCTSYYIEK